MTVWLLALALLSPQPPTPKFGCTAPEYRQFDFWIGDWEVLSPKGAVAGTNVITREFDDCVIQERWRGARGMTGSSFNTYDVVARKWHQTWVDNTGLLLTLEGEFRDGAMRLTGRGAGPKGSTANRVTWTPLADGTVRQTWEMSVDDGKSWTVAFDGTYRRRCEISGLP